MAVTNSKVDTAIALADLPTPFQQPTTSQPDPAPEDYADHINRLVQYFEESEESTRDSRTLAERDRDYYDNDQWTPEELAILRKRKQPALTINYIKRKVEFMRGFERRMRSDPKAFPRNPQDEQAAGAATDALRYVADQNDFDETRSSVYENMIVEGFGGADVTVERMPNGEDKVVIERVSWDRIVIDPHSRLPDFSDSRYKGIVIWLDAEQAKLDYPGFEDAIDTTFKSVSPRDTYGDRPANAWCDSKRKRVRVVQMHYKDEGEWFVCTFTKGGYLVPPVVSPYEDKYGRSASSLVLRSAYIDRRNNRYGAVRDLISLQDEINKRRSKALHLLSVRQTFGNKEAIADTQKARLELAKPDGHVEINGGAKFGEGFGVLPTGDMAMGQIQLMQQAVMEMQASGPNAAMAGKDPRAQSGRALEAQAQGGAVEMEPLVDELRQWTRDVYEAAWMRVRQFWTDQKWVRVTDDDRNIKFVGLNQPVTVADKLGQMQPQMRAAWMQQNQMQPNDPRLEEVVGKENDVSGLDVDIVIEEGPDVSVLQSEQFDLLTKLAQMPNSSISPKMIVQASALRNKDVILDEMENGQQLPPEVQKQMQEMQAELQKLGQENQALKGDRQLDLAKLALENKKLEIASQEAPEAGPTPKDIAEATLKTAQADKTRADAEHTRVETARSVAEMESQGLAPMLSPEGQLMPSRAEELAAQALAAIQQLSQVTQQLSDYVMAPRAIIRDPQTGQPVAMQVGDVVRPLQTDESGRVIGLQ